MSAVTAVSAVSGQNAVSAVSRQPCFVHALVHRVVFWREVQFRPVSSDRSIPESALARLFGRPDECTLGGESVSSVQNQDNG